MNIESLEQGNNWQLGRAQAFIYRRWHQIEKGTKGGVEVIDFDLAPGRLLTLEDPPMNRAQVEVRLLDIRDKYDKTQPDGEHLSDKGLASIIYLRALQRGERLPFKEYVEKTLGVTPQEISSKKIQQQYDLAESISRDLGYKYDKVGWKRFDKEHNLTQNGKLDKEAVKNIFERTKEQVVPIMFDFLGISGRQPEYSTSYEDVNETWFNWVYGDRVRGSSLVVNLNTINRSRFVEGTPEILGTHELSGHIINGALVRKNIDRRLINPGYGVTTIPGPEQWSLEGIATTLPHLVRPLLGVLTDYGRFALEIRILNQMVYNNIQIRANSDSPPPTKELVQEVQYYLPGEGSNRIKRVINLGKNNPRWRSYYMAYQNGTQFFLDLAEKTPEDEMKVILREVYNRFMTPRQIKELVKQQKDQRLKKAA